MQFTFCRQLLVLRRVIMSDTADTSKDAACFLYNVDKLVF